MRSHGTLILPLLAILWLAAVSCAASSGIHPSAVPAVSSAAPNGPAISPQPLSWSFDGTVGARATGVLLGRRLLGFFPFVGRGRAVVASSPGALEGLEEGVSEGIGGGSVRAIELGLKGSAQEIAAQLDPATFRALIWLNTATSGLSKAEVELWDLEKAKEPRRIAVKFIPAIKEAGSGLAASPWLVFSLPVCGLAWQPGQPGGLWVRQGAEFIKIDLATREQTVVASPPEIPAGACLLRWVDDLPQGGTLACFGLASKEGAWLLRFLPGKQPGAEQTPEFPLPEKAKRFLAAPFQPDSGNFILETTAGEALGAFTDLVWLQGAKGTAFAALSPDGTTWGVRGDLLAVIPGPKAGACSAIAASGHDLFLARAAPPYMISSFSLQADQSWLESAPPLVMPSPVLAMVVETTGRGRTLFILSAGQPAMIFKVGLDQ